MPEGGTAFNQKMSRVASAALLASSVMFAALLGPMAVAATVSSASSTPTAASDDFNHLINNYQDQIQAKRNAVAQMKQQMAAYQQRIDAEHTEAVTVTNQLQIVQNKIAQTDLSAQSNQTEIDLTNLELRDLDSQIQNKTLKIIKQREMVAEFLRVIDKTDTRSAMELLLTEKTFSDFFNDVQFLQQSQRELKGALDVEKALKSELETRDAAATSKRKHLDGVMTALSQDKDALSEDKNAKIALQTTAQIAEARYNSDLRALKQEAANENSDIAQIERKLRKTLDQQKLQTLSGAAGDWAWPVSPGRGISTYFHDPDYPFRYIFEHPGLDIRAAQGTPIHAAKGGYVAKAHDGGLGYSYIMLVHDDGISTVYGHVSRILVKEDTYVEQGDVIGLSGATPGTPGAGPLTTGPHLHLEIRLNGIPVDPLQYLSL